MVYRSNYPAVKSNRDGAVVPSGFFFLTVVLIPITLARAVMKPGASPAAETEAVT